MPILGEAGLGYVTSDDAVDLGHARRYEVLEAMPFSVKGLRGWLRERGISELTVLGLATDYCVKFTVLDALNLGYTVNVITDGCRGVNIQPQDSNLAFMEMAAAGATLYTLDDWLETHA